MESKVILVPYQLKEDLKVALEIGIFDEKLDNIFILSEHCDKSDFDLIANVFSESETKHRVENGDFISDTIDLIKNKKFESAFINLKKRRPKTRIEAYLIEAIKEYVYSIYFICDKFFNNGLFACDQKWIDGSIILSADFEREFNSFTYTNCPIKSLIAYNRTKLLELFACYEKATRIMKLKFLSAYFLVASCFFKDVNNLDIALLYLHRAIETLYISWCLEDNLLNINLDGKVDRDNHVYLKGYLEIIRGSRAISDSEIEAIDKLNKARNNNKLTHDHTFIDELTLSSFFNEIKKSIECDKDTNIFIASIKECINFEYDLYKFSRIFLIKKMFVKRHKS